jgi:phosphatidylserine/phosphatidylglycerophosphate/cardiolipin synthase-like enzyme
MRVNPNVEIAVQEYIQKYMVVKETCSIKELIRNYKSSVPTTEAELRNSISNALRFGHLQTVDKKTSWDDSTVIFLKPFLFNNADGKISIVISKPRLKELSLGGIEERNKQMDSIDCFREIIASANKILRICSPFLQRNVLNKDAFPDLKQLIIDAFERDVYIKLLSRELFQRRGEEIHWIADIARDLEKEDKLTIVDYHIQSDLGEILSSTHAKLLIADHTMAYVGSAELRRNSLIANFEVGCLISGPAVVGICEAFDSMFNQGKVWK